MSFIQYVLDKEHCYWNWSDLSANPNISFEDVLRNPDRPWDYRELSRNPNITLDIVDNHPEILWSHKGLTKNPNITMDMMKRRRDIRWDTESLSENPNITWDFIMENPDIEWNYVYIAQNANITWDIIHSNKKIFDKYVYQISQNPNITWDIVTSEEGSKINWDYQTLVGNPGITIDDFVENIDFLENNAGYTLIEDPVLRFEFRWHCISMNPNVTWEIINSQDEYSGIHWHNYSVCLNPNISLKIIRDNSERLCYHSQISKNTMTHYPHWNLVRSLNNEPYVLK